ncbi:hypothetical protein QYF52_23955 [Paenibacillus polymyxa]|uniref:hypothetical protein n=1 Tax=Paenibacillus TaxID=44249 RepID=UPI0025B6732B|nr:hypothetical protein [Paenibacillus polymyxa]MDN4080990.1 hypothetical protein [Paenibacillus polymyxa]MDN4106618.1 hypothetical protein [Paenibacillus polymyxa]MDN4116634.1 hypothetical protein [Paenibacillus polymyxa]
MKTLKVKPYNDLWLDCVNNNLIGILTAHDPQFEGLPCFYKWAYTLNVHREGAVVHHNDLSSHIDVMFERPDLTSIFEEKRIIVNEECDINKLVCTLIDDNYYVFLNMNRYYFPGSADFNKTTFVHPSFIYGYDSEGFKLLEDCVQIGTIDYYELDNTQFSQSFQSALGDSNEAIIHCVRLRDDWSNGKLEVSKSLIDSLLTDILGTEAMDSLGQSYKGLIAIKKYAEMFNEQNVHLLVEPEQFMWFLQQIKRGVTMQKRILMLLKYALDINLISTDSYNKLSQLYNDHHEYWVLVTSKIGRVMYKNSQKYFKSKLEESKKLLLDLYEQELSLTKRFQEEMNL